MRFLLKNRISIVVFILIGGSVFSENVFFVMVSAQTPVWSTPVVISPQKLEGERERWFSEIVVDLDGNVHVFWTSARSWPNSSYGGYDLVVYCKIESDACSMMSEIIAISWSAGVNVTRPMAIVDSQNTVHLLVRGVTPSTTSSQIQYQHASADQVHNPSAWSLPRLISSGKQNAAYSNIVVDQKGVIHVVWSESVEPAAPYVADQDGNYFDESENPHPCPLCADIFYRQSTDYGYLWSPSINLTQSILASDKPQLLLANNKPVLYMFWEEGADFYGAKDAPLVGVGMVRSFDDKEQWSRPTMFPFRDRVPQRITAAIDLQDRLMVVWTGVQVNKKVSHDVTYYQISTDLGHSWSIPQQIPGIRRASYNRILDELDMYEMVTDSAGHHHLILVGRRDQDPSNTKAVLHLEWDGENWSEPNVVFSVRGDLPQWPRIAIGNGNQLHATWFVRNEKGIFGGDEDYKIWYASAQTSAPMATPIFSVIATSTPTPNIPTATPTPISTVVTPTPTLDPAILALGVSVNDLDTIYTDLDDIQVLFVSLIPSIILAVITIFVTRFMRRHH